MVARRMSKFSWIIPLLLLGIMELVQPGESVCCPSKVLSFRMIEDNDDCSSYNAEKQSKGVCKAVVCGDGTKITGRYCGIGSCNIFGCRCDGGCRAGDAVKRFTDFYGDYHISHVHVV
ncbi:protein Diedel [Drosophila innubila]|uniref:protein Diedel n=1 Tax=Drosophila innubila TaxID=198719 RepID=UPI00148B9956|nr:protein Diedel [Drosophila innubila]